MLKLINKSMLKVLVYQEIDDRCLELTCMGHVTKPYVPSRPSPCDTTLGSIYSGRLPRNQEVNF